MHKRILCTALLATLGMAIQANAAVINFTGGTAYFIGGGSGVSNGTTNWGNVDYYEEDGFRIDFVGGAGSIGTYYGMGNDVLHAHWDSGDYGTITMITATRIDSQPFDLNYFVLTSNTDTGGSVASGNERAFINNNNGNDIQLPVENWGFPAQQIFLPGSYDGITSFSFYVENAVDCFGMDEFYIDEAPPGSVPDGGSTLAMMGLGLVAMAGWKKKSRNRSAS